MECSLHLIDKLNTHEFLMGLLTICSEKNIVMVCKILILLFFIINEERMRTYVYYAMS